VRPTTRVNVLIIGHLVLGLAAFLAAGFARVGGGWGAEWVVAAFLGVVFCQAGLLAVWAVHGVWNCWERTAWMVVGSVYLDCLIRLAGVGVGRVPLATVIAAATAGLLAASRPRGLKFRRVETASSQGTEIVNTEQLAGPAVLIASCVVACSFLEQDVTGLVAWLGCAVVVGVISPCATLGARSTARMVLAVLIASELFSLGYVWIFEEHGDSLPLILNMCAPFVIEALLLIVSCLWVRDAGYRLAVEARPKAALVSDEGEDVDVGALLRGS
jgi:hypothetical protein